jgi:peptide/nickel transport system substrate-binding protein
MAGSSLTVRRIRRRRVLGLGAGAIGVTTLGLAGCGTSATAPAATTAPAAPAAPAAAPAATSAPKATPKYGGVLKEGIDFASRHLDPHSPGGVAGFGSPGICYSQLLTLKSGPDVPLPSHIPDGDLAESWQQADDLAYIFKLRQGVKFHNIAPVNGRELVADDVVYSFNRVRELKGFASLLGNVIKNEAVDKYTVKLTLDKPNADALVNLAAAQMKIVAREAVAVNGNLEAPPVIGSGPWVFQRWSQTEGSAAQRNPDYFRKGLPYLDAVEIARVPDITAAVSAFRSGQVNLLNGVVWETVAEIQKAMPQVRVYPMLLDRSGDYLSLSPKFEPFRNIKVRQAINKAIDRQAIVSSLNAGHAVLSAGVSLPAIDWFLPEDELKKLYARDVEGARRLMREAGMEAGFEVTAVAPTTLANFFVNEAELIAASLKDIGVRMVVKPTDPVAYFTQLNVNRDFQVAVGYLGGGAETNADLYNRYYTGGASNITGSDSPELNNLIDQQVVMSRDPEGRKKILQQIQRMVIEQSSSLCLALRQASELEMPEVKDLYLPIEVHSSTGWLQNVWIDK